MENWMSQLPLGAQLLVYLVLTAFIGCGLGLLRHALLKRFEPKVPVRRETPHLKLVK